MACLCILACMEADLKVYTSSYLDVGWKHVDIDSRNETHLVYPYSKYVPALFMLINLILVPMFTNVFINVFVQLLPFN